MLNIDETPTAIGLLRKCPLCRSASHAPRTFVRNGVMV